MTCGRVLTHSSNLLPHPLGAECLSRFSECEPTRGKILINFVNKRVQRPLAK